ncbi:hypothetical protein PsorP6_003976 [Peronosclerospora sorghi]|uniref:Uncharacterized protein n=1 Tax=Peronosclerospora sorghi TaxID=230839 RepID=A0ACC0VP93_9STRA|nr:hypothetical protein PsorP6_003976 [Peronosclerospora sorghi]
MKQSADENNIPTVRRRVLVTGAAGFIGFHTAKALLARGDDVVIIDELNDYYDVKLKQNNLDWLSSTYGSRVTVYIGDICDQHLVRCVLKETKAESIVHLAARAGVRRSIDNPLMYIQANVVATMVLLDACREFGVKKVVYASSSSVYGGSLKDRFSVEDIVDFPVSPYDATKKSRELLTHTYHHLHGMDTIGLRFFTLYGPRGRPDMAPFKFMDRIARGVAIDQYGDGSSSRDYTFTDDIVQGVVLSVAVTFADGSNYPAVIHSADILSDIALLQIKSEEVKEWPKISIGSSSELRAGEWVCALGSPFSLQNSASAGIISAVARHSSELGYPQKGGEYIQTDAAINAGNSGGPLINLDGEVIGINTMKVDGSVGISFAIPADTAIQVIDQLRKHKKVVRPYIGMQMINFNSRELREIGRIFPGVKKGVIVKSIVPGSPAHKGGLLPGDVIVSFDGKEVLSTKDILTTVGYNIGRHIPVQVKRRGENNLVKLEVITEPLPAQQQFLG